MRHITVLLISVIGLISCSASKLPKQEITLESAKVEGLRTQLKLKALPGFDAGRETFIPGITETLNLNTRIADQKAFGYMQGIKANMDVDILTETKLATGIRNIDWASGLILSENKQGIILVKESNKSTSLRKKEDVATGSFLFDDQAIFITGAGMFPENLKEDKYFGDKKIWLKDLLSGKSELISLKDGQLELSINKPAGFKFYQYELRD